VRAPHGALFAWTEAAIMSVDRNDVERIARLARIDLSAAELRRFAADFRQILEYFDQIRGSGTGGLSAEPDSDQTVNVTREDEVQPGLTQEQALRNAPDTDGEYFCVPRVLPSSES
jgi:aspartyl-tRNA(Asn)/glutamyl-tRNA(Gln) amidotransferase subunit C